MPKRDTLYASGQQSVDMFTFDHKVADVFPDMINRSVPGYSAILSMIGDITERFAQDNSYCYDLGCSLGAASVAMAKHLQVSDCRVIGIDNSQAMIERCQQLDIHNIDFYCKDITQQAIQRASVVVLNFTLQFIPLEHRQALLKVIYDGLLPGGVLVLSEKVCFEDSQHQQLMTDLHHQFKRDNGYSDLEIAQKRTALENVLLPETIEQHKTRLIECGFSQADLWFQCFNFSSFIALKER